MPLLQAKKQRGGLLSANPLLAIGQGLLQAGANGDNIGLGLANGLQGYEQGLRQQEQDELQGNQFAAQERYQNSQMQRSQFDMDNAQADRARADATRQKAAEWAASLEDGNPLKQFASVDPVATFELYGKILAQKPNEAPSGVQEYEYAVKNGFGGSFMDFKQQMAAAGRAPNTVDPYFTPIQTSGGFFTFNNRTGQAVPVTGANGAPVMPVAIDPAAQGAVATAKASGTAQGKAQGEAAVDLPAAIQKGQYAINVIDQLAAHPGRSTITGKSGAFGLAAAIPGSNAADAKVLLDQIGGTAFLEAFDSLRGAGQITEVEGVKATQAIARLSTAQSDEAFAAALAELRGVVNQGLARAKQKAQAPGAAASPAPASGGWSIRKK